MIQDILEAGSVLIVIAGIVGGFISAYRSQKTTTNTDATETISIKESTIQALRGEVAELRKTQVEQEKRIKDLELINATYVKLFQGDPSQLESYMRDTASSMEKLATAMASVLSLVQQHQPTITINK